MKEVGKLMKGLFSILRLRKRSDRSELSLSLSYWVLPDSGGFVAYTPVLDYSTCGDTEEKARKMFAEGVMIFLKELIKMGTLEEVLKEHGWRKIVLRKGQPRWVPPRVSYRKEQVRVALALPE